MEDPTFSDKIEEYLSELGRWLVFLLKVWRSILLGQVLSLLLSGKCILTTLLQSATWQFPTTGQLVVPYLALFILFTPSLLCNGLKSLSNGVGAALVGGAWRGQRLGVVHVAGATMGLMAVVCVVWADVEGAPTDGKNQLVGDMLCLAGSLLYAMVTVLQEMMLDTLSCSDYLAFLGLIGSIVSCTQTFFLEFGELMEFNWEYTVPTLDCIPIEGLEPPMSRDTTFTSFLGGPQTAPNGTVTFAQTNGAQNSKEAC
ncbi:hypothetical protein HF086_010544 [Spodoptera exigua]|uniref:Uncharacterized protein n=1 Tax=Spodoptera exigua TaxID=7107 RepID=A0A922SKD2_SPOEX|nr:hypothetical protein HF086_010544 [Spodoptera exigua]